MPTPREELLRKVTPLQPGESSFTLWRPQTWDAPIVTSIPHGGLRLPWHWNELPYADQVNIWDLLLCLDNDAGPLYEGAHLHGPSIQAQVLRPILDVNRDRWDMTPDILEGPWHAPLRPMWYGAEKGIGLMWAKCDVNEKPLYGNAKITLADAHERIDMVWHPYHDQLDELLQECYHRFGWGSRRCRSIFVDCHTCATTGSGSMAGGRKPRPDVIIGDLYGTTCPRDLTALIARTFERLGWTVGINDPFPGTTVMEGYSNPPFGRYSLMLDVAKRYMDEETLLLREDEFVRRRRDIGTVFKVIAEYAVAA